MIIINERPNVGSYLFCDIVFTSEDLKEIDIEKIVLFCAWKRFEKVYIPNEYIEEFMNKVHDTISGCTHRGSVLHSQYEYYSKWT